MFVVWTAAGERKFFFRVLFRSALKKEKRGFWGKTNEKWEWAFVRQEFVELVLLKSFGKVHEKKNVRRNWFFFGVLVCLVSFFDTIGMGQKEWSFGQWNFRSTHDDWLDFSLLNEISNHRWRLSDSILYDETFSDIFLELLFLSFDWIYLYSNDNFVQLLENKQPTNLKWQLGKGKEKLSKIRSWINDSLRLLFAAKCEGGRRKTHFTSKRSF